MRMVTLRCDLIWSDVSRVTLCVTLSRWTPAARSACGYGDVPWRKGAELTWQLTTAPTLYIWTPHTGDIEILFWGRDKFILRLIGWCSCVGRIMQQERDEQRWLRSCSIYRHRYRQAAAIINNRNWWYIILSKCISNVLNLLMILQQKWGCNIIFDQGPKMHSYFLKTILLFSDKLKGPTI